MGLVRVCSTPPCACFLPMRLNFHLLSHRVFCLELGPADRIFWILPPPKTYMKTMHKPCDFDQFDGGHEGDPVHERTFQSKTCGETFFKAKTLGHVAVQTKTHGVFDNYAQQAWSSRLSLGRFAQKCAPGPDQVGQSCPDRPILQCQTPHAVWFGMRRDLSIVALSAFPLRVLIRNWQ